MKPYLDQPIQRKMLLLTLSICGVVLLVAGLALFAYQSLAFRASFQRDIATLATIIANNSTAAMEFKDFEAAGEIIGSLAAKPFITSALLTAADGSRIAHFGQSNKQDEPGSFPPVKEFRLQDGDLLYTQPVELQNRRLGTLYIRADFRTVFLRLLGYFSLVLVGILLASAALAVPLSERLQRSITQPILQLAQTARHVGEKQDYSARATGQARGDELGDLAAAFNKMIERIQSQDEALRESEARYRLLIENQGEGAGLVNSDEVFTLANPAADDLFGLPRGGLLGRSLRDFVSDTDYARMQSETEKRRLGARSCYDLEIRHPNGVRRLLSVTASPIRSTDGRFIGTFGVFRDISEQKRAEEELRECYRVERLLSEISKNFINLPAQNISMGIDQALRMVGEFADADRAYLFTLAPDDLHASNTNEWCAEGIAPHMLRMQNIEVSAFPWWVDKLSRQETIHVPQVADLPPEAAAEKLFVQSRGVQSVVAVPMVSAGKLLGFLGFDAVRQAKTWTRAEFSILTLAVQIFVQALDRQRADHDLQQMHQRLLRFSRQAGMAEVATGVLHNVGNVLNSVNVSATLVSDRVRQSKLSSLARVTALLAAHKEDLAAFFSSNPKGRLLPDYLNDLTAHLQSEQESIIQELCHLTRNVEHIKEIVAMQQSYARVAGLIEPIAAAELVEDALRIELPAFSHRDIRIARHFNPAPSVLADRHKVLQILVNLLSNARHAFEGSPADVPQVQLEVRASSPDRVCISVRDNGVGIAPETLTRIFNHGFTTRKDGHGFGLHSGALAAKEMGGSLSAHSDGLGHGATFVLELPVAAAFPLPSAPEPVLTPHLSSPDLI